MGSAVSPLSGTLCGVCQCCPHPSTGYRQPCGGMSAALGGLLLFICLIGVNCAVLSCLSNASACFFSSSMCSFFSHHIFLHVVQQMYSIHHSLSKVVNSILRRMSPCRSSLCFHCLIQEQLRVCSPIPGKFRQSV
ncbi:hypothetical protein XENOCAPTIV_029146 [Xenoophorus captivus]|uniref:Uncharacterized protein n=1 Tax=Xenoophorus captivus TaxID=1517983 RepID=A0ABV0RVX2_9TELE